VSTTPLRQWGFQQCLPFSWTTLRGKHCWHPIAVMEVVDTLGHSGADLSTCLTRLENPNTCKIQLKHLESQFDRLLKPTQAFARVDFLKLTLGNSSSKSSLISKSSPQG
jgi:hypothetical protein